MSEGDDVERSLALAAEDLRNWAWTSALYGVDPIPPPGTVLDGGGVVDSVEWTGPDAVTIHVMGRASVGSFSCAIGFIDEEEPKP